MEFTFHLQIFSLQNNIGFCLALYSNMKYCIYYLVDKLYSIGFYCNLNMNLSFFNDHDYCIYLCPNTACCNHCLFLAYVLAHGSGLSISSLNRDVFLEIFLLLVHTVVCLISHKTSPDHAHTIWEFSAQYN